MSPLSLEAEDGFGLESGLDPQTAEAVGWQILVLLRCACVHSGVMAPLGEKLSE